MLSRRNLLLSAATAAPLAAATGPAYAASPVAAPLGAAAAPGSDALLHRAMSITLTHELGSAPAAAAIEPILYDVSVVWDLPLVPAASIDSIVAYAFGNRPNADSGVTDPNGGTQVALPDPGPTNELLADAVHAIYTLKPVMIYAQWEIARFLVSKYGMTPEQVYSVEPIINADGTITYLSTDGVALDAIHHAGSAAALGQVAVVGHRDHAKRCIQVSESRGMNAGVAAEVPLPVEYDAESGQAWTRNRGLYLVHDMYAQLFLKAIALTAAAYPAG